ncbi:MAG: 3-hydroxy-3-methylglutaryl CoA synthase [Robiginitomaculum sp.]|nr:MAG: 3-hydroxy-3-methylglutaryl CoA synthase [Robiginitomaculum sp.]
MKNNFGILAYGAYVPRRRLQRTAIQETNNWYAPGLRGAAKGEKAICNWDEDVITMAVEAGRDCLQGIDRTSVDAVRLASTTFPNADRSNAGIIKEVLTLRDDIAVSDAGGSQRAASSTLAQALSNQKKSSLVIASERRLARAASPAEMAYGDAAAGVLIGRGDVIAKCIAQHSVSHDFVDHFRASGAKFDYEWEARWIRDEGYLKIVGDAISTTLSKNDIDPQAIDHVAIAISARGVAPRLAKAAGLSVDALVDNQISTIGQTGAAYPLMLLVAALERAEPGEKILLASFGQGADILIFEVTGLMKKMSPRLAVSGWLAQREVDTNYSRYLFHRKLLDVETGMRAEGDNKQPGSTLYRHRKSVMGLVGGRCAKTGTVQFPRSEISVNPNERAQSTQEEYPMAEIPVTITTFTSDRLTFSPDPPSYYGMVDFEGGGRLMANFTDISPDGVEVGQEMRMVFRVKAYDNQREFTQYFWKAAPAPKGDR